MPAVISKIISQDDFMSSGCVFGTTQVYDKPDKNVTKKLALKNWTKILIATI
jgi:hypothetical protein